MEKTYPKDMNLPPHPLDHAMFILVIFINWICLKLVTFAGMSEMLELFFAIPLKILPFLTAYVAYRKHWHETARDIKKWIKRKING